MTKLQKLGIQILASPASVYLCVIVFIVYFGLLTALRHQHLLSLRLDLGNMDQTVWNIAQGHGFVLTDPESDLQVSRLAYHADFFLVLLAPLYWIWASPYMLLFTQVIIVGLGALPVYWIADRVVRSKSVAFLFAISYLLYPPLEHALMYDFHAVTLATTFLLFAYWYADTGKWFRFVLFAILAGICKEQIWVAVSLFGVYIAIWKKKALFGSIVALASAIIFYILFWKVIPSHALANQHFALKYLSDFGGDLNTIIISIFRQPSLFWKIIWQPDRGWYLFQRFIPIGFLSLVAPWKLAFAGADFAISLLSNNGLMRSIEYQYNSAVTPFIFISAIEGFAIVKKHVDTIQSKKRVGNLVTIWFIIATLASSYVWGVLPKGLHSISWFYFREPAGYTIMKKALAQVDSRYSVSVTNNLGAQLSQRQELYNFPVRAHEADYVFVKLDDAAAWPSLYEQQKVARELLVDPNYELFAQVASFSAFRRKDL